tara:strand:- start:682 stop:1353 length:672 start_codon:yes stop_codon:yes gene_type:complete
MDLPTTKTPATKKDPGFLLLYGSPKTGKTSTIAKLDNCLIIDTERGTQYVDAMKVYVNSLSEYQAMSQSLSKHPDQYDYIALDTVDNLAAWIEQYVCAQNKVATIGDMEFGKGFALVREAVIKAVQKLGTLAKKGIIIVGHTKTSTIVDEDHNKVIDINELNLTGKLKNELMSAADGIGFVYREDGNLKISFKTGSDNSQIGSRCPHLANQILDFDWSNIYID